MSFEIKIHTKAFSFFLLAIISLSTFSIATSQAIPSKRHFFKIRILAKGGDLEAQAIANFIIQELGKIRLESTLITHPKGAFESALASKDFDLVLLDITWPNTDVDPLYLFSEIGSTNYWGIDSLISGAMENEFLLTAGRIESDDETRKAIYYDWQDNLMNNILPIIPLYSKISSYVTWNTLSGWNHQEGIIASLPYMEWISPHHTNQNTSRFIDYLEKWTFLNPLFVEDNFMISLIAEPLLRIKYDRTFEGVLAESWTYNEDKTILSIQLRENVFWQDDIDSLYQNEIFTADDVIFSIKMYQNLSTSGAYYHWTNKIEKENDLLLHIYVDGDNNILGLQPYAPALAELDKLILPEHYLNVSVTDGFPDTKHDNWIKYGMHGLGTGMYYLEQYTEDSECIFNYNKNWWGTQPDIFNPAIKTYVVRFLVADPTTRQLEFMDGALDIFKDFRTSMTYFQSSPYIYETRKEYDVTYLGFNLKSSLTPEIADTTLCEDGTMTKGLAVRKAIAHLLDKTLISNLQYRNIDIIDSPLSEKFGLYVYDNITTYPTNVEIARQFMLKAGFDPATMASPNFTLLEMFTAIIILSALFYKKIRIDKNKATTKNR